MRAKVWLLCEDDTTQGFVRRFLWRRRIRYHDVYNLPLPTGGSGEQWVRERFPDELQAIRRESNTVLIVVTDADTNTTRERRLQLDRQCDEFDVPRIQTNDPAVVLVPRRNIETWLQHLDTGEAVNETHDYKQRFRGLSMKDLRGLADELYRICHEAQKLSASAPRSLREACMEYPKITRFVR